MRWMEMGVSFQLSGQNALIGRFGKEQAITSQLTLINWNMETGERPLT